MMNHQSLILVVDDNERNLKLISELLKHEGLHPITAANAEEAQALVDRLSPELILMDVHLPGMDGLTLTRALKADPRTCHITIAALTASTTKEDELAALAAGCDGYITKPIKTRELPAQVINLLRRSLAKRPVEKR